MWSVCQSKFFKWCLVKRNCKRSSLQDQFKQTWLENIQKNSKTLNCRLFKDKLEFENYFDIFEDRDISIFCHFRTVNHKLPIEYGRWNNIQRENWVCNLCNSQDLGDEFHYLLKCSFMSDMRKNCINNIFFRNANILKFGELMIQTKLSKLKKLCVFIRFINNNVCPPG
jgi:hypothetical protein